MRRFVTVAVAAVIATIAASLATPIDAQTCLVPINTIASDCDSPCLSNQLCKRKSTSSCTLECIKSYSDVDSVFTLQLSTTSDSDDAIIKIAKLTLPSNIIGFDIAGNGIRVEIADNFLASNTQLTKVKFEGVALRNIVDKMVANLPLQLEYLTLKGDFLMSAPLGFARFKSLAYLNLGYNSIPDFDARNVMDSLNELDLSSNSITSFTAVFPNLAILNLYSNELEEIPAAIFKHTKLQELDLTSNNLLKDVKLTASQASFLSNLTKFEIDIGAFSTNCPRSQRIKIRDYDVCITGDSALSTPATSNQTSTSTINLPLIITSSVGSVFAVLLIVVLVLWKKRRNNRTKNQHGTDYTAATYNSNGAVQGNSALWNDPDLLACKVNEDNIQDVKKVGGGAFCDIWLVLYRGTQRLASKRLREVTRSRTQGFIAEIKLVATLSHPNIVAFVGAAWTQEADLQALFEFMDGGDLRDYLQNPQVPREWTAQKLQIAIDIVEALVYVHSFAPPLVHRDLKSRNVLLDSSNGSGSDGLLVAKLTDFGVSRFRSDDNTMTTGVGTGKWLAPEVITGDGKYGAPADIFSFGAVLSELDTHKLPYEDMRGANGNPLSQVRMLQLVASGELRPSFLPSCPSLIAELAQRCLALRPEDRPSAPELAYALRQIKKSIVFEV